MKSFILIVLSCMMLTVSRHALAQCPSNNCPPDDGDGCWNENNALWTIYSGCQVDVDYCYREIVSGSTIIYQYIVNYIQVESGCTDMSMSTLMGDVASQLYATISNPVECDGPLGGELISISANNCWKYDPNPTHFPGSNIGPGIGVYGYLPCGTGTCTKTCSLCFGYSPSCSCYEIQLSDCSYTGDYSSGCIEDAVNIYEFTPINCYHLPCGW